MFTRMAGLAAASFVLLLSAASPVAAHDVGDDGPRVIVAERYSAGNDGNPQIVAVDPRDGRVTVLTAGSRDVAADISPDARNIVFERCPGGVNCDQVGTVNIWIMAADGSHQRPLTACDGTSCLGSFDPHFSPDGRLISFSQDLLDANGVNFNGVFTMRTDGSQVRRVTSNGPDKLPDGGASFSPDGRQLVFTRETPVGNRLILVGVDGTDLRQLLPGVDGFGSSWSPDGRRIAFTLARHGGDSTAFDIATVRPDGTHLRRITNQPAGQASAFDPDYSRAGRRLVISESDGAGCHLALIDDTGQHRTIIPNRDQEAC